MIQKAFCISKLMCRCVLWNRSNRCESIRCFLPLYLNLSYYLFKLYPGELGGGVNDVPSEGSDGSEKRVLSDNEQGGVDNGNGQVEDDQQVRNGPGAPVANEPVGGKNHCW